MAVAVIASRSVFEATVRRFTEHGMIRLTFVFLLDITTPLLCFYFRVFKKTLLYNIINSKRMSIRRAENNVSHVLDKTLLKYDCLKTFKGFTMLL